MSELSAIGGVVYVYGSIALLIIMAGLAYYSWRRRAVVGARTFAAFLLVLVAYLASNILLVTQAGALTEFYYTVRTSLIIPMGLILLLFVMQYTGKSAWLTPAVLAILWLFTLLCLLLIYTNSLHHLMWTSLEAVDLGQLAGVRTYPGELDSVPRIVTAAYSSFALLWILITLTRSYALYRRQAVALLIGVIEPAVLNSLISLHLIPTPLVAVTPLSLSVTALAFAWAIFPYRLFELKPIAQETLVEKTLDGMLVLDNEYHIVDLNPAMQAMMGATKNRALGQNLQKMAPDIYATTLDADKSVVKRAELALQRDGTTRYFDLRFSHLTDSNGKTQGNMIVMRDMTERAHMEQALRRSEALHRQLFEEAPMPIAVYALDDADYPILVMNRTGRNLLLDPNDGADPIGISVTKFIHPDEQELARHVVAKLKNLENIPWLEERLVKSNGQVINVVISETPITYQNRLAALVVFNDVTELKHIQTELQRREQTVAILEERARLGRNLHDSVTQLIYSVMLFADASQEAAQANNLSLMQSYLERVNDTARQALRQMRLQVFELRPSILEQEGLQIALRQRLELVEQRSGIATSLDLSLPAAISAPAEVAVYWIVQEALNNMLKHSSASHVHIRIHADDTGLHCEIEDNGKGFDMATLSEHTGLGLANMRERARDLGGTLAIHSAPGQGTKIEVTIPAYVIDPGSGVTNHPKKVQTS